VSERSAHVPIRSCAGCRQRDRQASLRRFTLAGERLVWDRRGRARGRGAYLHARPECFAAFVAHKPLVRSLRASVCAAERSRLVAEQTVN